MMFIQLHKNKGFTLVELLIVIAIITILATFLIPSIGSGRERARQAKCLNNVRVLLTQALLNAEDYTGNFQGYPTTLGSMFSSGGNIDIAAADCPSTSNIPTNDGAGGAISSGDYTLVTGYTASSAAVDPLVYDIAGNHTTGQNCGYLAGNVKLVSSVSNPAGTSTTTQ
jgi:prepilin-type N-terminal cleavage/methylation domain-containing protein